MCSCCSVPCRAQCGWGWHSGLCAGLAPQAACGTWVRLFPQPPGASGALGCWQTFSLTAGFEPQEQDLCEEQLSSPGSASPLPSPAFQSQGTLVLSGFVLLEGAAGLPRLWSSTALSGPWALPRDERALIWSLFVFWQAAVLLESCPFTCSCDSQLALCSADVIPVLVLQEL